MNNNNNREIEACEAEKHLSKRQLTKIARFGGFTKFRYFVIGFDPKAGWEEKISVAPKTLEEKS